MNGLLNTYQVMADFIIWRNGDMAAILEKIPFICLFLNINVKWYALSCIYKQLYWITGCLFRSCCLWYTDQLISSYYSHLIDNDSHKGRYCTIRIYGIWLPIRMSFFRQFFFKSGFITLRFLDFELFLLLSFNRQPLSWIMEKILMNRNVILLPYFKLWKV